MTYNRSNYIFIALEGKKPIESGWQNSTITVNTHLVIQRGQNIGLVLGEPSGDIVDVDIDSDTLLPLAGHFLPTTEMIFGRNARPKSHYIYHVPESGSIVQVKDSKGKMLIEYRANGGQTMFPPSIHPTTYYDWKDLENELIDHCKKQNDLYDKCCIKRHEYYAWTRIRGQVSKFLDAENTCTLETFCEIGFVL